MKKHVTQQELCFARLDTDGKGRFQNMKGAEAKYFINAADTGHRCWCSVHSPSSTDAIDKLADYVMCETKYSKEEATYMLKDLGTVIFMQNFKVYEISEISGYDYKTKSLIYTPVYKRPVIENAN